MGWPAASAGLIGFGKIHLFGGETLLAIDGSPGWRSMPTAQELLIDGLVTASTIPGRQLGRDHEAVMVLLLLAGRGLVAVETVHPLLGVQAHLIFVDHRILGPSMTFRAFSGGTYKVCAGLFGLHLRPRPVEQKRCQDEGKCNHHGQENGSKRHAAALSTKNTADAGARQRTNPAIVVGGQS